MKPITVAGLLTSFIFLSASPSIAQEARGTLPPERAVATSDETALLTERLRKPEHLSLFQSAMWTLTHDYGDKKHVDEVLKTAMSFFEAFAKHGAGDSKPLVDLGGVKGFKGMLSEWLNDGDQAVRAFSAVLMGISGDKAFAPQLHKFLLERKGGEDELMVYDRGRALVALGLLGSKEYTPDIRRMLQSKNEYDRSGAITALGSFAAKEYAGEIAALLSKADVRSGDDYSDDPSPIFFLIETETAKDYKKELAQAMLRKYPAEVSKAAMYALAHLDAKEHARDIATLLGDDFRKADAAKALALLNALEYSGDIAKLLADDSGLVRSAAALSLGVLKADKYSGQVAKLLSDREENVRPYAANALLLMGAERYYKEALPFAENSYVSGQAAGMFLFDHSFHPLVEKKSGRLADDLRESIDKAKAAVAAKPSNDDSERRER